MAYSWRCVLDARAAVGESPVWAAEEQALYWVDIVAPALYRFHPASGATRRWAMPSAIGSFGLCQQGGAVVALKSGVHRFDFATGHLTFIAHPEVDLVGNRYNDGKTSPEGRFWFGSMDDTPAKRASAALYRLDPDGSCHRVVGGLSCSNGLAWSPDGRTLYHADSRQQFIKAYDYDPASGEISSPRVIAEPDEATGRPDGAAVDCDGCYWSAGVSAGRINRYSPAGELLETIPVPTPKPTCCCFGGPDMKTLFITSLRLSLSQEILAAHPTAGSIFATDVTVPGFPDGRFAG